MSRLQIRWPHVFAFLFGAAGLWGKDISDALQGGATLSLSLVVAQIVGSGGLLWALAEETVIPDLTAGGGGAVAPGTGTTKVLLGGSGHPPPMGDLGDPHHRTFLPGLFVAGCAMAAIVWTLCLPGCSTLAAAFPELDKIEQLVATDLAAGKTAEQIEADVAVLVCPNSVATLCVDAVVVVNDAVAFLIDTGVFANKPASLAAAKALLSVEHAKLAARGIAR
jgi:hypothetical protein